MHSRSTTLVSCTTQGVKQDDKEAVAWYKKAAAQGLANAQTNLGAMYVDGTGVPQDFGIVAAGSRPRS